MSANHQLKTLANPFYFDDLDVRTAVDDNDNVWFCAKDVCDVLDIVWKGSTETLENMPENWKGVLKLRTPSAENGRGGGEQNAVFINEPGLYRLIFRSNKPKAVEFSNWVCETVLPEIRRHGCFGQLAAKDYIAVVKQIADLTDRLTGSKNAFTREMLLQPLKSLCNLAGHPMPDLALIQQRIDQTVVPGLDGGEA